MTLPIRMYNKKAIKECKDDIEEERNRKAMCEVYDARYGTVVHG